MRSEHLRSHPLGPTFLSKAWNLIFFTDFFYPVVALTFATVDAPSQGLEFKANLWELSDGHLGKRSRCHESWLRCHLEMTWTSRLSRGLRRQGLLSGTEFLSLKCFAAFLFIYCAHVCIVMYAKAHKWRQEDNLGA